jgi:vancomycin resistance protein VanJ
MTGTHAPPPSRFRRIATAGIVLQVILVIAFIGMLLVGERGRIGLVVLYLPRWPLFILAAIATLLVRVSGRHVRFLLPMQVVIGLVLLFPVLGFKIGSRRTAEHPIHLASYNVYFGKINRPELVEEIARMPADVVVLQAASAAIGARIRARLPDRSIHQENQFVLISRLPVIEAQTPSPLPSGASPMFAKYVIDSPKGPLRIFAVHPFSAREALYDRKPADEDIALREAQISAVVAAARSEPTPFVIIGDTNVPVLSSIARRHFASLTDAWDDVGFGFGWTFPARHPWMRIDRALAGDGVRFVDMRVGRLGYSDHLPIYVDLELTTAK